MSQNIDVIRQSITVIAKILSGKGIKVTQSGTDAYVESVDGIPKRINIPYIPDNASDDLILAINGFLDHEVAHVLFTDFKASKKNAFLNESIFQIYNAIEDCRIEKRMREKFAGSRTNLDGVSSFFIEKYIEPQLVKCVNEVDFITTLFTPAIRAWSGQEIFSDYMKDKWTHISQFEKKIASAIPKIELVRSTQDSVELAHVISSLLKSEDKSSKTKEEDKSFDELDERVKGGVELPPSAEPEDDEPEDDEPEEESDEDEESDDEEGEEDESEDLESDDDFDEDKDTVEEESEADFPPDEELDEGKSKVSLDIESLMGSIDGDMSKAISGMISSDVMKSMKSSEYTIYSNEFDLIDRLDISKLDPSDIRRALNRIEESARQVVGPLQKTLERLVKSKSMVRNLLGKRSGRINAPSLFRLKTGDDRVFRQRDVGISNDVAVSLVVDCSGSMSGEKIRVAMESAYALCDVLSRLNITNEVIGFTTLRNDMGMFADHSASESEYRFRSYSRYEALHIPIFKGFDEKFGIQQKQRIAVGGRINQPNGLQLLNNVDGESIRIAADRLLKMTREKTKQMIILSDGMPSAQGDNYEIENDLKNSITKIEKAGIKIIGIGIKDDSVSRFYKNNMVIRDVSELPSKIIEELRLLLI